MNDDGRKITLALPLRVLREAVTALKERTIEMHNRAVKDPRRAAYWRELGDFASDCAKIIVNAIRGK